MMEPTKSCTKEGNDDLPQDSGVIQERSFTCLFGEQELVIHVVFDGTCGKLMNYSVGV